MLEQEAIKTLRDQIAADDDPGAHRYDGHLIVNLLDEIERLTRENAALRETLIQTRTFMQRLD